jgi:peptide methionine sulfoxide reductase msrA/msrB
MERLTKNTGKRVSSIIKMTMVMVLMAGLSFVFISSDKSEDANMNYNELTPEEEYVMLNKGTEKPFTGLYYDHWEDGSYTCKRCDAPLYKSSAKFDSHCGWPSFDDEIPGAVKRVTDADGVRTEILCNNCGAHLGHVFEGEGYTDKNIRHCVNSVSMNFIPAKKADNYQKAYFAGGCFWGVEYYFQKADGVISTTVGYMGGSKENPSYKEVSYTNTGHAEAIEVVYDPELTSYEDLAKLFFEIHDPTQVDRQGPDIGEQYRSEVFYVDENQMKIVEKLIGILTDKGYKVATRVTKAGTFWDAEDYHQDYYEKKNGTPYCHSYQKRF